jgi:hypothetical protein
MGGGSWAKAAPQRPIAPAAKSTRADRRRYADGFLDRSGIGNHTLFARAPPKRRFGPPQFRQRLAETKAHFDL